MWQHAERPIRKENERLQAAAGAVSHVVMIVGAPT